MNDREKFRKKMKLKGEIAIQNVQKSIEKALETSKKEENEAAEKENIK